MKNIFLVFISVIFFLTGCKNINCDSNGIGRKVIINKATDYSKITVIQSVDTAHYFSDNDIIKTEIWLGDKTTPNIFSFGSIVKEVNPGDREKALSEEYDNAYKESSKIRQKLINGGMIVAGNENIDNEDSWLQSHKMPDVSADFTQ